MGPFFSGFFFNGGFFFQTVGGDLRWASGLGPRKSEEERDRDEYNEEDDIAALLLVS